MPRQTRQTDTPAAPTGGYAPQLDGVGDTLPAPIVGGTYPALLMVHPEHWHVQGGRLVPATGEFPLQPGVNGVTVAKGGRLQIREATARIAEQGWRVIPVDVDGPGTSYLADAAGAYRWQRRHPGSRVVTTDEAAYLAWLSGLVARGAIDPAPDYVLDRLRERYRQDVGELSDLVARGQPSAAPQLERARSDLAVVEAEIERRRVAA